MSTSTVLPSEPAELAHEGWELLVKHRCFTIWLHATPEELLKRTKTSGRGLRLPQAALT